MSASLEVSRRLQDGPLSNADLAPVPWESRTWNTWHIASLWVGMVVCIPTYMLASSMIQQGMNWWQAILTVLLGNLIVLAPMVLNGAAGTRYGLSFPVLIRASFGTWGTHVPSLMRALVACGWFGIQTAVGGSAIYELVEVLRPGLLSQIPQVLPPWIGLTSGRAIGFFLFWLINVYFVWAGTESIKWLETLAAPLLLAMGLALLAWAVRAGGGFQKILVVRSTFPSDQAFWQVFWPSLTAMVGFWATLSLNIPDFTRFATSQSSQVWGQVLGLPLPMALFAFIGVATTGATQAVFQEVIWDPVALLGRFQSPIVVGLALIALLLATLTTNIAANIVAPATAFSNLAPRFISLRTGGLVAALIGVAIMPWKLLVDPHNYIFTWLVGYSALLGPIAGLMIADYFVVQRRELSVPDLYDEQGIYGKCNVRSMVILALAILPNVPGFLTAVGWWPEAALFQHGALQTLVKVYPYAWFVGFFLAFVLQSWLGRPRHLRHDGFPDGRRAT